MKDRLIELCENIISSCKVSMCDSCEHNNTDYPHCMSVRFADKLIENGAIFPKYEEEIHDINDYFEKEGAE